MSAPLVNIRFEGKGVRISLADKQSAKDSLDGVRKEIESSKSMSKFAVSDAKNGNVQELSMSAKHADALRSLFGARLTLVGVKKRELPTPKSPSAMKLPRRYETDVKTARVHEEAQAHEREEREAHKDREKPEGRKAHEERTAHHEDRETPEERKVHKDRETPEGHKTHEDSESREEHKVHEDRETPEGHKAHEDRETPEEREVHQEAREEHKANKEERGERKTIEEEREAQEYVARRLDEDEQELTADKGVILKELLDKFANDRKMHSNLLPNNVPCTTGAQGMLLIYVMLATTGAFLLCGEDTRHIKDGLPKAFTVASNYMSKKGKLIHRKSYSSKPRYSGCGYVYSNNMQNSASLSLLMTAVRQLDEKYKNYTVSASTPTLDKKIGIIGWDVAFTPPAWLATLLPTEHPQDARMNPILEADGRLRFQKSSTKISSLSKALQYLRTKNAHFKAKVSGEVICDTNTMREFLRSPTVVYACVAWSGHARFIVKRPDLMKVLFYDPWKTSMTAQSNGVKAMNVALSEALYTSDFVARQRDQAYGEGSCGFIALTRVIMMVLPDDAGEGRLTLPMDASAAILASRLISKFRRG